MRLQESRANLVSLHDHRGFRSSGAPTSADIASWRDWRYTVGGSFVDHQGVKQKCTNGERLNINVSALGDLRSIVSPRSLKH